MAIGDESLPLVVAPNGTGHRDQHIVLAITAFTQILTVIGCAPPMLAMWHPYYFPNTEIEQRAWSWLGMNSFWFSLPLIWTLFHRDNGPAAAAGCLLSAFYWAYVDVIMVSEWIRGLLAFFAIWDFILHSVLGVFCAGAAWSGVASPVHASRADGSNTRKREFRKWALVSASLQLFMVYLACWPLGLPIVPSDEGRETAPWEYNSATLLTLTLAILWAAFLTRGGYVDQTKQAMCGFCAIMFLGGFVLSSFDWPYLGLVGHSVITTAVLVADAVVSAIAALN